jgi:hypothetical protein
MEPVTIREYIEARRRLIRNISFFWLAAMVIGLMAIMRMPLKFIAAIFVAWFAMMFAIIWRIRRLSTCPRCGGRLLQVNARAGTAAAAKASDFCKHCGVSIDEAMVSPTQ